MGCPFPVPEEIKEVDNELLANGLLVPTGEVCLCPPPEERGFNEIQVFR